jgi:hypothetical protein
MTKDKRAVQRKGVVSAIVPERYGATIEIPERYGAL